MTTSSGLQWSSRLTFLMATVGCAVGLGNIWRFPYAAGVNGGGAFVLVYIGAVILLALPVLIAELLIGRRGGASPPEAIEAVAVESGRSPSWRWMGIILGGVGAIMALSFYAVVGGWTLAYVFKMASGQLMGVDAAEAGLIFDLLNGTPESLLLSTTAFMAITVFISTRGLHAGIERAVNLMMPALFVMLVAMVIYSMAVGDVGSALNFLFKPDFDKLTTTVVLGAFGQAFFSVSVGITNVMAYGAYMRKTTNLPQSAVIIAGADTLVALLAGLAIFPIIFSFGLEPGEGPGLVFMSLPLAFGQMPGGLIFGALFFTLLSFAALTSSIAMLEAPVSWLVDSTRLSRRSAALFAGGIAFTMSILAALSFNVLSDVHPLGAISIFSDKTFFALFDYFVTNILMPLGGLLIAVFAGWIIKRNFSVDEFLGGEATFAYRSWLFLVRFLAPLLLAYVFFDMATS